MSYTKTNWANLPSTSTPINATNLNKIEDAIKQNDASIEQLKTYSTTNEAIVGTWIDGKPLYRKVYSGNWTSTTTDIDTSVSNYNIISMRGIIESGYGFKWNIPNIASEDGYRNSLKINTSNNKLQLNTGSFYNTSNKYVVIIEYTKSTD